MKLGNTDRGTGIVCDNKLELALSVSALGDILDLEFWCNIEEGAITLIIGREPVYIPHIYEEIKSEATSSFLVEILRDEARPHNGDRYIIYTFDVDPRRVINRIIHTATDLSAKKPYKL